MVKQDKIVIYLEKEASLPSWALVSSDEKVQKIFYRGGLHELTQAAVDKEMIVLVPAEDVLLVKTKLPKMNRSRLLQALPYALEEQLIAEVETLHFAPLHHAADGSLIAAVVAKEKMQAWIAQLTSWQIQADVLLPLSLALPLEESTWSILVEESATVRTELYQGFGCDKPTLAHLLLAELNAAPPLIHVYYSSAKTESLFPLSIEVKEHKLSQEEILSRLALSAIPMRASNLLQGQYAAKKNRLPHLQKMGKAASYLAAAWVVLLLLYPTISYFVLNQRLNGIENEMKQIYQLQFPQASAVIAPRSRMEEKLQKLTAGREENRFFILLAELGKGMASSSGVNLKRIDFQNNQLTLELNAASSEDFSALTNDLTQQGLTVKQQSANLAGSRINAAFIVE